MNITIRPCTTSDLKTLQTIGRETYDTTFRHLNTQETMETYLQEAFNKEKLTSELSNPNSYFYFLYVDEELAGYLKLNDPPAQSDLNDPDSLEIERIYLKNIFQGKGLGAQLMQFALKQAEDMNKQYAWLGVWEKNTNAIAFYEKMGFEKAGKHSFQMGEELQSDWVLKIELPVAKGG